ncbi:DNA starvation/stationary phase protection protein [Iodidimonas nitroreducens]|uniref:DNA starvation/stationary phase protection protein n=1 Tax=Iodidimonas nitroreducens TaxID=1236968 RepID=A0A5A7NA35_9PROT|nr:Dps family protein [Iodidimonas nitroreducens]GAK33214.1 putative protein [alpha proteobacterium Q-1]GER04330.1 DNA starvation/stationary phase protection protein [Iodidimonas nitroreducens]
MAINIGLDKDEMKAVTKELKGFLADSYALYLKTHNYHWNVTGPLFKAVHELTEQQYLALAAAVDDIAERIRTLGEKAPGSFAAYAKATSIKDGDETLDAEAMLADLVKSHETVIRSARHLLETASKAHDESTVALISDRLADHEKQAWMLRSLIA